MDFTSNMPSILLPEGKEKKQDKDIVCWSIFLADIEAELNFAYSLTFLPSEEFPHLFLLLIFSPLSVAVQTLARYIKANILCPMSLYCSNSKIVATISGVEFYTSIQSNLSSSRVLSIFHILHQI